MFACLSMFKYVCFPPSTSSASVAQLLGISDQWKLGKCQERWFTMSTLWISTPYYYLFNITDRWADIHACPHPHNIFTASHTISCSLSVMHVCKKLNCLSLTHIISPSHRGEISQPCCMKAPRENHRELKMPNSLGGWSVGPCSVAPSSGSSACHSYGLKRLTWGSRRERERKNVLRKFGRPLR